MDNFESQTTAVGEEDEKRRMELIDYCNSIIEAKKNKSGSIKCQVCEKNVRYMRTKRQDANLIFVHACTHLTTKVFSCRVDQCEFESETLSGIKYHGTKEHKIGSPKRGVHFDEYWTDTFENIKESLTRYFLGSNSNTDSSTEIPPPPSELSIQRRLIADIIESAVKDDKIRCGSCGKSICGTARRHLEQHIYVAHLKKPIYECARCGVRKMWLNHMKKHITNYHNGVSLDGNFTVCSDEYHEEILEWAKKCFGKKASQ